MASHAAFTRAYELLERVTPLRADCGRLCGARCCTEWEKGVGMYLLPGEECMFSQSEPWLEWQSHSTDDLEFCPSWKGHIWFVVCNATCPRGKRPFACRTFPLVPHLRPDGVLTMALDPEGLLVCPLVQLDDLSALDQAFVSACAEAWRILIADDKLIADDVRYESERRERQAEGSAKLRQLLGPSGGAEGGGFR